MELSELLERQRAFFAAGTTRPLKFRMEALERLGTALSDWEDELARALKEDLNKDKMESYMCETGLVREEIRFHRRHLSKWVRDRRVPTPLAQFPSRSFRSPEP